MAISIRKLAPEEAQRAFPRRGQQDLSEYVAALREIEPGEAVSIDRQGLSDRAIKRRLGQAAKSLGYRLKWSRQSSPEELYLQVLGSPRAQAATCSAPELLWPTVSVRSGPSGLVQSTSTLSRMSPFMTSILSFSG